MGSQLLPPLLSASAPRGLPVSRRPTPGEEDHRRGLAREAPNPLGALLREFLPNRFREFLCRLKSKSVRPGLGRRGRGGADGAWSHGPAAAPPQAGRIITISTFFWLPASSASQHQVGVSKRCRDSQCPKVSFLPDLRSFPLTFALSFRPKTKLHSAQSSKLKAVLTHSSSGERLGPRKRCCPFRVRFADETLRDTALRYWERSCAFQQNLLESETATQPVVSEQVFRSVSRWLESLPRALCPGARQEKATASSSWSWDCPSLSSQEPQGSLFDNASMSSSLPRISRATTHKQRGHLRTHLDTHNILEQMGKLPRSWSQKLESFLPNLVLQSVLKRGHPKGYQLLLPLKTRPRTQR
uniref:DUF4685 domain-containing protein n=1 Tax=Loxodonta africana TaxID=9785 RepID=G3SQ96_LOXAF